MESLAVEEQKASDEAFCGTHEERMWQMTREETIKLFDLLDQLYQSRRKPRTETVLSIWEHALKPWSYSQVRRAVLDRVQAGNPYSPDPAELVAYLPEKLPECAVPPETLRKYGDAVKRHADAIRNSCHEAGLPAPSEALKRGIPFSRLWQGNPKQKEVHTE